jgi:hypothetical protein
MEHPMKYEQDKNKGTELFFDPTKHPGCLTISPASTGQYEPTGSFRCRKQLHDFRGREKDGDVPCMQRVALSYWSESTHFLQITATNSCGTGTVGK